MGQGRNGGGPLSVWPTLLDVLQRPSLDRCCRHLRGVRVSSRTEKPGSGMWSKQWARQTQGAPPAHPPAQTYTHTPLCTTLLLPAHGPALWGYPRPEQEAKGLQPVLLYTLAWHMDIWEPEDSGFWGGLSRKVALPTHPAPQWLHVILSTRI